MENYESKDAQPYRCYIDVANPRPHQYIAVAPRAHQAYNTHQMSGEQTSTSSVMPPPKPDTMTPFRRE